jgi:hypothetical protein
MFRFTIRDLLWLTLLAAIVVAWWVDRRAQARRIEELEKASILTYWGDLDLSQATLMLDPVEVKSESPTP